MSSCCGAPAVTAMGGRPAYAEASARSRRSAVRGGGRGEAPGFLLDEALDTQGSRRVPCSGVSRHCGQDLRLLLREGLCARRGCGLADGE